MNVPTVGYQSAKVKNEQHSEPIKYEDFTKSEQQELNARIRKKYEEKKELQHKRLSPDQKKQIQSAEMIKFAEERNKIQRGSEKPAVPSVEVVKAAEKAIVKQKKRGKRSSKEAAPKRPLPEKPAAAPRAEKKEEKEKSANRHSEISFEDDFQVITQSLKANDFMTGSIKNPFAAMLAEWKTTISALEEKILDAQAMKNTLSTLWKTLDKEDQYDEEYTLLFNDMWQSQNNFKEFKAKNEKAWGNLICNLKKIRSDSEPKPIPPESQKTLQRLSTPTSSETKKDTEKVEQAVKETDEIETSRNINYRLSLWCSSQLEVHIDKLCHRINEIDGYLETDCMQKFNRKIQSTSEHILTRNNKKQVIDEMLLQIRKILSAKEHIDLILAGLKKIKSSNEKRNYLDTLSKYNILFKSEVQNLQQQVKETKQKLAKSYKELDKVIDEENIDDFPTTTLKNLRERHKDNPERLNEITAKLKMRQTRKKAAITQKRILKTLEKNMDQRMTKNTYISWGVIPLYDYFLKEINSLKS